MKTVVRILAAAAAVAAAASSAAAQSWAAPDLARYDARAARSVAEQLVLCDLAGYFATGPDLGATRFYLQRDNYRYEPSSPFAITRGLQWHDEQLERAFLRRSWAGEVDRWEVAALRRQYGMQMERGFRRTTVAERRFFHSQASFCRHLARSSWRTAAR